jgi:hypothetical protein
LESFIDLNNLVLERFSDEERRRIGVHTNRTRRDNGNDVNDDLRRSNCSGAVTDSGDVVRAAFEEITSPNRRSAQLHSLLNPDYIGLE